MIVSEIILILILGWIIIYPLTDFWVRNISTKVLKKVVNKSRKIYLTFDDGPNPLITPAVLEILAERQVPALFFLVGFRAKQSPELVWQIVAAGHEIGIHTYDHQHAYLLFIKKSIHTIKKGKQALEKITKQSLRWFRPPWGALNLFQFLYLKHLQLKIVLWTANAIDWDLRTSPAKIITLLKRKVKPGSIIVIHDAGGELGAPENMLQALPEIIDEFQRQGYQFASLPHIT